MNGYQRINAILSSELRSNANLHIIGESLALAPDTTGLQGKHPEQVHLLPVADNAMLGVAIGMAFAGKKVVLNLSGPQSLWSIIPQLGEEISNVGREFPLAITIRVPVAPNETVQLQSVLGLEGICVAAPSSATQASMMLQAALQTTTPTILLEDRMLLLDQVEEQDHGDLASAVCVRSGEDTSLLVWGNGVKTALEVAEELQQEGVSVEVIDVRVLHPLDETNLSHSIQKTGRPILVNAPSSMMNTIVNGAFWRLENQPQNISANSEEMREAIFKSLRY